MSNLFKKQRETSSEPMEFGKGRSNMIENENTFDVACFEVNQSGRILSGNKRFCRMFGFSESEVAWHYITDCYRYRADWEMFSRCDNLSQTKFIFRMRNRKGRSFKCCLSREIVQDAEGRVTFRNTVSRLGEPEEAQVATPIAENHTVVFITKCAHCGGQVRVNTIAETRMRVLCDHCAAKVYPEAFNLKTAQM